MLRCNPAKTHVFLPSFSTRFQATDQPDNQTKVYESTVPPSSLSPVLKSNPIVSKQLSTNIKSATLQETKTYRWIPFIRRQHFYPRSHPKNARRSLRTRPLSPLPSPCSSVVSWCNRGVCRGRRGRGHRLPLSNRDRFGLWGRRWRRGARGRKCRRALRFFDLLVWSWRY